MKERLLLDLIREIIQPSPRELGHGQSHYPFTQSGNSINGASLREMRRRIPCDTCSCHIELVEIASAKCNRGYLLCVLKLNLAHDLLCGWVELDDPASVENGNPEVSPEKIYSSLMC